MRPQLSAVGAQLLLLISSAATLAHAQRLDAASGSISPPGGVPSFDPQNWHQAYLLTLRGVPRTSAFWPTAPGLDVDVPGTCKQADGGVAAVSAKGAAMRSCWYMLSGDSSFDLAIKLPGAAFTSGNCYCYAMSWFRGSLCLPGTSGGGAARAAYRSKMTCAAIVEAVTADGGRPVSKSEALSAGPPAGGGHYIVMMARPESCIPGHCGNPDFHVMRKDADGGWSWKLPNTPASNRDLEGARITDPDSQPLPGHYQTCGYFHVQPSKMVIGVSDAAARGPLDDMSVLEPFRAAGRRVTSAITPVPYEPASDGRVGPKNVRIFAEDREWEAQRGMRAYEDWRRAQREALEMTADDGGASSSAGSSNASTASTTTSTTSSSTDESAGSSTAGRRMLGGALGHCCNL